MSSLMLLYLSGYLLLAIAKTKLGLPLVRFYQLRKLEVRDFRGGVKGLIELLHVTPFLESLVIEGHVDLFYDLDGVESITLYDDDYDYDSMKSVPSCIRSHLKKFAYYNFDGKKSEYDIAKFLMKNGAKLKKFCIPNFHGKEDEASRNENLEKLSTFHKASTSLEIVSVYEKDEWDK